MVLGAVGAVVLDVPVVPGVVLLDVDPVVPVVPVDVPVVPVVLSTVLAVKSSLPDIEKTNF